MLVEMDRRWSKSQCPRLHTVVVGVPGAAGSALSPRGMSPSALRGDTARATCVSSEGRGGERDSPFQCHPLVQPLPVPPKLSLVAPQPSPSPDRQ